MSLACIAMLCGSCTPTPTYKERFPAEGIFPTSQQRCWLVGDSDGVPTAKLVHIQEGPLGSVHLPGPLERHFYERHVQESAPRQGVAVVPICTGERIPFYQTFEIIALDGSKPKILWSQAWTRSHVSSSPAKDPGQIWLDDSSVWILGDRETGKGDSDPGLCQVSLLDGKIDWHQPIPWASWHLGGSIFSRVADSILVGSGQSAHILDRLNGQTVAGFEYETAGPIINNQFYFRKQNSELWKLDLKTRKTEKVGLTRSDSLVGSGKTLLSSYRSYAKFPIDEPIQELTSSSLDGKELWHLQFGFNGHSENALKRICPLSSERLTSAFPWLQLHLDGKDYWVVLDVEKGKIVQSIGVEPEWNFKLFSNGSQFLAINDVGSEVASTTIAQMDASTGALVKAVSIAGSLYSCNLGFGQVWIVTRDGQLTVLNAGSLETISGLKSTEDGENFQKLLDTHKLDATQIHATK